MRRLITATLLSATALSGCTLAPRYERPTLPIAQSWPTPVETAGASAADLAWRDVFKDERLSGLIDLALRENRDLRVAVANIEKARAQYRVQRAALLPSINAVASETRAHTPASTSPSGSAVSSEQYSATVGFSAYEVDLFGRVRSLNRAALQSFFAVEENRRAAQISLIAEVAADYFTLAADQQRLQLVRDTLATREDGLRLAHGRFKAGAASGLDVRQAETLTEQARSDLAVASAQVEQDKNALRLVVGAEIPGELMPPDGLDTGAVLADLPPGLASDVLARRPDVLSAEHALEARNANIGAARAAFFPRITLTGDTGAASTELSDLFTGGTGTWSFIPKVSLPIFSGGANVANLRGAKADRDVATAQYEKAVQTAFREVADALAVQATMDDRLGAQERLAAAAADSERLSRARYQSGVDGYLTLLDAQRTLYSAQQGLLNARLAQLTNRVNLYKALGGGA